MRAPPVAGPSVVRTEIHVDASPDSVFAVLADGARYADWVVGAKKIRATDPGFPRPGTRLHHTLGTGPVEVKDTTTVLRSEPLRFLELDAHMRGLRAIVRFELLPDASGTTVVMEEEGGNTATRLLTRLSHAALVARNADTLWRLREQVLNRSDTRRPMPTPARVRIPVPRWLGDTTARFFAFAAAFRGSRPMHPRGVGRRGTARLTQRGSALADHSVPEVIARFSRGAGLPPRLPDVNGLALRFVDASGPGRHLDLLLASTGPGLLGRVPVPAVDFGASRFSSILRYRFDGEPVVFVARFRPRGMTLDRLRDGQRTEVELSIVTADGTREALAHITLDEVVDAGDLRFDPTPVTANIVPLGFLNALRSPAYTASQSVRADRPRHDATAVRQGAAT